ncbi:helix-turn-helix transcriptional regulator [Glaciecola sp. SC05]|uniref:helix-turn-helix transcriptional regulator n=1 Tax=Glaciecola sp. SC05 TaxID=1987355 RepID=UPI003528D180
MKDTIITIILITIMTLNGADVFVDIGLDVPMWHIAQEAFLVLLSAIGAIVLIFDMRKRTRALNGLAQDLSNANHQIESLNNQFTKERKHFSQVIKSQFDDWKLTPTEQEVAFLLLKGLSLREISSVRDTKEATVRQQASSVYAKSNLVGRHEFSAWFLEDFLHVS